jgi:hypothetical protein
MENGLLRLHSTYRHDLKIYTADEGRVQSSAAAFTKVCAALALIQRWRSNIEIFLVSFRLISSGGTFPLSLVTGPP